MGRFRTTIAAMLAILAFAAFQPGADAQTRRGESRSNGTSQTTSRSNSRQSTSRKSISSDRKSSKTNREGRPVTQTRPAGKVNPSKQTRPSGQATRPATRPGNTTRPATRPSPQTRPNDRPSSNRGDRPSANRGERPSVKPADRPQQIRPDHRHDAPRVHPRDRDFMRYDRPSHYWAHHNHFFGHRIHHIPARAVRHIYHGISYYCFNDIWYRPYGGYYIVCRPPFGTILAANLIADMAWTAVRLSYIATVANTYSQINENNEYIAEQNAIIAQNNATIAAQNQAIAANQQLASEAYSLANGLGLIQSYAAADSDYFYQDGIFYMKDSKGEYVVIVPPAGALVETLPEDYDMVTLNDGKEYYKVDDTVYRITLSSGKPYFEVLGQMN